ncbi:metalloprotease TldD [Rhodoligotrophos appendicifer]|uniref:metalloprotease TldD n=1 Tax=Rhodoligotrophos appendicifer TaxID=987056 RepID=UPI001184880B|nr:metalloprotease TldD [Rhodoligotrophos appendicifer]
MTSPDQNFFFAQTDLVRSTAERIVAEALSGADDGELFLEYRQSESFVFDDGVLRGANFDTTHGFGLRAICGEAAALAHSSEISEPALRRASEALRTLKKGSGAILTSPPPKTNLILYSDENPLEGVSFPDKVKLLEAIDAYARSLDTKVVQVSASLVAEWQVVEIIRGDGSSTRDIRPLVRLNVSVVSRDGSRQETGSYGIGGRAGYTEFISEARWKSVVDEALRQSLVNLDSRSAPAGEMDVVLAPGWPGILLHEAVGHGLEGDFNRKRTSAFADLVGHRVAAKGVTVIDDGTLGGRRGSLTVDDEGTPSRMNVLIEDGILKGFMQDRLNARLMGVMPTGNGRRQSHAHLPMPRMTNTYMISGKHEPEEIISSVKSGLYAASFGGGQVDITSGKFVFSCTEAYQIENGKLGAPVKGATIIGNGPDALTRISMIGNDMKLDPGIGTCGKRGQGVPVGVGQPTIRLNAITVGGTG